MAISFNEVPNTARVPWAYVEFDASNAQQGPSLQVYKALALGQLLSTGSAEPLTPVRVTSNSQAAALFGEGSMLAGMVEGFREDNTVTELWVIPVEDDEAAVKASGSILFGGAQTVAGVVPLYIAGRSVRVAVGSGDSLADIATATAAAINANASLPVTAEVNGGTEEQVDITAKNAGEVGNTLDIRVGYFDGEKMPDGLTATVTAMTGGVANPDLTDALAAMGDEHYNVIAHAYTDAANLSLIEAELASRWGPLRQIEGAAIAASNVSHSALGTLGDSRNSPHSVIVGSTGSPTPPYEYAANVAGVVARHGQIDPARPFQTLTLSHVKPPKEADRFTWQERNLLLFDGIATAKTDAGGVVRIERLITTYKTNAFGASDTAFLDLNTVLTLGYLRFDFRNLWLRKYPRHKLAADGNNFGPGQDVMTPKLAKAECVAWFRQMEELGLVEGIDQFKRDLIVERSATDETRLDIMMPPDLVNQLRVTGVQIGFLL